MSNVLSESSLNALFDALNKAKTDDARWQCLRHWPSMTAHQAQYVWQDYLSNQDGRKSRGAYYTDLTVAHDVIAKTLAPMTAPPTRILEPACGSGNLLIALLEGFDRRWSQPLVHIAQGIDAYDTDTVALRIAQWQITERWSAEVVDAIHWFPRDALTHHVELLSTGDPPTYDLIVGNPPFGNAIDKRTGRNPKERQFYQKHFPRSARGAFDKCALFVDMCATRLSSYGTMMLILPRSWLAQPASLALRRALAQEFDGHHVLSLPDDTFHNASVSTIALILDRRPQTSALAPHESLADGKAHEPSTHLWQHGHWGAATHFFASYLQHAADTLVPLSTVTEWTAGASTEEAYAWKEHLRDGAAADAVPANDEERPLLIAGMIDPFVHYWGKKTTRYLGDDYLAPLLHRNALSPQRCQLATTSRVLIPTLSVALEAWPDLHGHTVGAVSTIAGWVKSEDDPTVAPTPRTQHQTLLLCAMLNSAWCRLHYACLFSSLALSGGNTQVSKNKLATIGIPNAWANLLHDPPPRAQHVPALGKALHAHVVPDVYKGLPSQRCFDTLLRTAGEIAQQGDKAQRDAHLLYLLKEKPVEALRRGWLDLLLLGRTSFTPIIMPSPTPSI